MPRPGTRIGVHTLYLPPDLEQQLRQVHNSLNPHGSIDDTIRELLGSACASIPSDGLAAQARVTAYRETARIIRPQAAELLRQLAEKVEVTAP